MKRFISILSAFLTSLTAFAQFGGNIKLPKTWEKDFAVSISFNNSMSSTRTSVTFSFDSCIYKHDSYGKTTTYALTEADRVEILKKLKALKVDRIKSEGLLFTEHDGWSQSIRIGFRSIEGGSSARMTEKDKGRFYEAYHYLEDFARRKTN